MRFSAAVFATVLVSIAHAAPEADMLQRLGVLSSDPAVQAKLADARARMADLGWMAGDWAFTVAHPGGSAGEPGSITFRSMDAGIVAADASTYITFDPFTGEWIGAALNPPAASLVRLSSAKGWDGQEIVFEGEVRFLGAPFWLRQTIRRTDADHFVIVDEQRLADGTYAEVDRYLYERRAP